MLNEHLGHRATIKFKTGSFYFLQFLFSKIKTAKWYIVSVCLHLSMEAGRASADDIILNLYIAFLFLGILKQITNDGPKSHKYVLS